MDSLTLAPQLVDDFSGGDVETAHRDHEILHQLALLGEQRRQMLLHGVVGGLAQNRDGVDVDLSSLHRMGVENATYGRAAKLVAIYLKTMLVTGGYSDEAFARLLHPPVDAILLASLAESPDFSEAHRSLWRKTKWTQLDQEGYVRLIQTFRDAGLDQPAFWQIERYWHPAGSEGALP